MTKVHKLQERGGNTNVRCNLCDFEFTGSYSRVKAHLMGISGYGVVKCKKVTKQMLSEIQKEVAEAEERKNACRVPLPSSRQPPMNSGQEMMMGSKRKKVDSNNLLQKVFNVEARAEVDSEIARAFYSGGIAFHLARNSHFIRSYTLAANSNIPSYVPPTYNALRTTLLQRERTHIERLLEPIKATWNENGVSLVSDGWSDRQRRPLINFMPVTEGGPMFLKAVNCEGEYKDKFFIANLIKDAILRIGPQHVVQVVTNNAPVCKAAGNFVESIYPHIFWTPCVVHTLNLALKYICVAKNTEANEIVYDECHWITEVAARAVLVDILF